MKKITQTQFRAAIHALDNLLQGTEDDDLLSGRGRAQVETARATLYRSYVRKIGIDGAVLNHNQEYARQQLLEADPSDSEAKKVVKHAREKGKVRAD